MCAEPWEERGKKRAEREKCSHRMKAGRTGRQQEGKKKGSLLAGGGRGPSFFAPRKA